MKLNDLLHRIAIFLGKKKHDKRDYLVRRTDIPLGDLPKAAVFVIKKFGWVVSFHKAVNYTKLLFSKYFEKIRNLQRAAIFSIKREGVLKAVLRIINFIIYGEGVLRKNIDNQNNVGYSGVDKEKNADAESISEEHFFKLGVVPFYLNPIANHVFENISSKTSIAIHLHLFYSDMIEDCIKYFLNIPFDFDLYISVGVNANENEIKKILKDRIKKVKEVFIEKVPNRGRDMAPLIIQFGKRLLKYDIISHVHTKKSVHSEKLNYWFKTTMDLLYGSKAEIIQIINLLNKEAKIIYPEGNSNIVLDKSGWSNNYELAADLLNKYTNFKIENFQFIEFPQGSMFWAKTQCLKDFLNLPLKYSDFPNEPIPADGTLAHALERLLLIFASAYNGKCYRIHKKDSFNDYRYYEEQQDYSEKIKHKSIKVLSYYLPQFHPIPENNKWHEDGFTEWHKVRRANPLFCGHYQQHIPHEDIGYYLLNSSNVLKKQAEMMKKAGVFGQVFYHYWFTGKLILEKPAQILLQNQDVDMPFCFCWANENWTKKWDGNEREILLEQNYSKEDAASFIQYLIPFFKDKRYIRIDNRPVIFIYRPSSFPDFSLYKEIWTDECKKAGLPEPYIVATLTRGASSPLDYGMDAGAERVLHDWTNGNVSEMKNNLKQYIPVKGSVLNYKDVADYYIGQKDKKPFINFRSIVPTWDNTARYGNEALLLNGSTPAKFQEWMENLIKQAKRLLAKDKQVILVNAWNEWAEGAHLEPDIKFGYGYLNSLGRALSDISFGDASVDSDNDQSSNLRNLTLKIEFTEDVLKILRNNIYLRKKFIDCIANSTIFELCEVTISNKEIIDYIVRIKSSIHIKKNTDKYDYKLLIGSINYFGNDMIEQLLKMGVYCKNSVVCANNFFDKKSDGINVNENGSINSYEAFPIRLYPNSKNDYKNYRICPKAVCSAIVNEYFNLNKNLPVVTTIVRFHQNADFRLLNNALLSLFSQDDCIVQPLIAAQDLSEKQLENLKNLINQYSWDENFKPMVISFFSDEKNKDLRAKMLNLSLKSVKTKYAAFLDYDDTLFPFAYKNLINRLKMNDKAVSFGNVFTAIFDRKKMRVIERKKEYVHGKDYETFLEFNHAPLHSFLLDLEKIDLSNIKYFDDMKFLEDYYLTLQIFTEKNVDWESLALENYIGDYIHSMDANHTLALVNNDKKQDVLKNKSYLLCENRIYELRKKIQANYKRAKKNKKLSEKIEEYNKENKNNMEYNSWINKYEKFYISAINKEINEFKYKPKISIITPVYNADSKWLERCIQSVRNQFYKNWELCLHDDASTKKETIECLKRLAKSDSRIKVSYGKMNQHVSGASNDALKMATGEFVALLDNDDEIAPHALFENVKILNQYSNVDFIYSDEDKMEIDRTRTDPFFKPDWSPDFFLSMNYTCHLGVYRKNILDQIGGFRKGYERAQNYDLTLRFIENTVSENIYHIPKILYHWRKNVNRAEDKSYAGDDAKKALQDYMERNNIIGKVEEGLSFGQFRIKRSIKNNPKISIIIPFRDQAAVLKKCLKSIFNKTDYINYEILLIDNESSEKETLRYLENLKNNQKIKIIKYEKPFNFSAINNYAVEKSSGEYILFLNNDIEVINREWLTSMIEHIQRDDIGAVGAKLFFPNDTIQHAGVVMGLGIAGHAFRHFLRKSEGLFGQLNVLKNYSAVTAACMMVKKKTFVDLGGFNEKDLPIAYNDVDLCLRMREKGYLIVYTPYAQLYHYESLSRGNDNDLKNKNPEKYKRVISERKYMAKKWKKYIKNDPYYNPNLTRINEDFSLNIE